ncbi:MAG: hypothetical protein NTZ80_03370 [Patescibacteria group bacterium]|nr:hypothetical protein [Patescibacteria group bacterium]
MHNSIFSQHVEAMEKAHEALERILPDHRSDFFSRMKKHLLIIAGIIIFGGLWWLFFDHSNKEIVVPKESAKIPVAEKQEIELNPQSEFRVNLGENLARTLIYDDLPTRAIARGVAMSDALSYLNFIDAPEFNAYEMAFIGLTLGARKFDENLLGESSFSSINLGVNLGENYFALQSDDLGVFGAELSQQLNLNTLNFSDRSASLTMILSVSKSALTRTSLFLHQVKSPPAEVDEARLYWQGIQDNAFSALEEVRQIATKIKTDYQAAKLQSQADSNKVLGMIDQGQAPSVSQSTIEYQESAATLASLEAEFAIYQKLEADFRDVTTLLKKRIDYIDANYNDLALGLCDWETC